MLTPDQADPLITQAINTLFEQWWNKHQPQTFERAQCRIAFIVGFKAAGEKRDEFLTLLAEAVEVNRKDG